MKLVHISDIHIHGEKIGGYDPVQRFRACLAHVEKHNGDADRIVITGDLTEKGSIDEYETLRDILKNSSLRGEQSPRLMIGNHDIRRNFQAVFPDTPRDGNEFVQYTEDSSVGRLVYVDSVGENIHEGRLDAARIGWLKSELERAKTDEVRVWLFMHHNPVPVNVITNDAVGLYETPELVDLLSNHRDIVQHIFFGHSHYILSGSVCGIPFSAPCSTSEPCAPEFSGRLAIGTGLLMPTYNVVFISERDTIVHSINFLVEHKMVWRDIDAERWKPQIERMAERGLVNPDWKLS